MNRRVVVLLFGWSKVCSRSWNRCLFGHNLPSNMDDASFLRRFNEWKEMSDFITDVRDFQLVKSHPYPSELKGQAFKQLFAEATEQQRARLPYLFSTGDSSCVYAHDLFLDQFLSAPPRQQRNLLNSPLARTF